MESAIFATPWTQDRRGAWGKQAGKFCSVALARRDYAFDFTLKFHFDMPSRLAFLRRLLSVIATFCQ
jgi:hypothetical protein